MRIFTLLARLWRRSWWTEHSTFTLTLNYIKSHHYYLKVVFLFTTSYITKSFAYIQILTFVTLLLWTIQTCFYHTLLISNSYFSHTTLMIQRSRICIKMNEWLFLNLSSNQFQFILSWFCLRIMKVHQFFSVRIMSRASHRNTGKRRVNQVNENSKLKSKIYWDAKTICTEERKALDSIEFRLASRTRVSVEDWARS